VVKQNDEIKTYKVLGFTEEEFLEIVEFFTELIRLDQKPESIKKQGTKLVTVFRTQLARLKHVRKIELQNELIKLDQI